MAATIIMNEGLLLFPRYGPLMLQVQVHNLLTTTTVSSIALLPAFFLVGTELSRYFHFTPYICFVWQIYQGVVIPATVLSVDMYNIHYIWLLPFFI
ncbi:hypothetical protein CPB84DRAFT_1773029 [Gymnopilus junonius]|uniref:Uncharacterized protein n=1 Tax=Gymnopilus junonius TaxID=109634 RepID=A0A9P5NTX5_GYMJU|nr:hypothetical protein CPB84DRAFT_1773029 [Gymnopilus junonius]